MKKKRSWTTKVIVRNFLEQLMRQFNKKNTDNAEMIFDKNGRAIPIAYLEGLPEETIAVIKNAEEVYSKTSADACPVCGCSCQTWSG